MERGCRWLVLPTRAGYRLDIIGGYRSMQLDDQLRIRESLTSLDSTAPGTFDISDLEPTAGVPDVVRGVS